MAKKYYFDNEQLILEYKPELVDLESIFRTLNEKDELYLGALKLTTSAVIGHDDYEETISFRIGYKQGDYYSLDKDIFSLDYDFMYHSDLIINKELKIEEKHFYQGRFARVINLLSDYANQNIRIVPNDFNIVSDGDILFGDYLLIIDKFPNQREINLYKRAVIESIIGGYFSNESAIEKYNSYVDKRRNPPKNISDAMVINKETEIFKYELILKELEEMLKGNYSEREWQDKLIPIILLMYPKYIKYISKVRISIGDGKYKEIDYLLIDADGNVDIIELKKPFEDCVLRKAQYRNNYVPGLELSGAIQQSEKYIYYLSTYKTINENLINEKYSDTLNGINIKIINPRAIIICGRSDKFIDEQKVDYEIIRRQYKSLIDIMTYDDLIIRVKNTLKLLRD